MTSMNPEKDVKTLTSRREILFLYDIRMGNPNGDPDENRPRVLPDGTFYVTDVRLKRFVRDFVNSQGKDILVGNVEGRVSNLTGRVSDHLRKSRKAEANGRELVDILLESFIDARWFGSSLAFKEDKGSAKLEPEPKTLTGAVQFNMGEVLHRAEEIRIQGTSLFASAEDKRAGTFTDFAALRYGLIAFNGVANEHSAKLSRMSDEDYDTLLEALWKGIRSAGNTRSKVGQVPRLLVSIEYKPTVEYQFGNLLEYVKLRARDGKPEEQWSSPEDYVLDIDRLVARLDLRKDKIEKIRFDVSPDIEFSDKGILSSWESLGLDD